jgi:hypothetical protein
MIYTSDNHLMKYCGFLCADALMSSPCLVFTSGSKTAKDKGGEICISCETLRKSIAASNSNL